MGRACFFLLLFLFLLGRGEVRAAPLVWDLKAVVSQMDVDPEKPGEESVVTLFWSPPTPEALAKVGVPITSYPYCGPAVRVFRHDRTDGRNFVPISPTPGWPPKEAFIYKASATSPFELRLGDAGSWTPGQSCPSSSSSAGDPWGRDSLYGYFTYLDTRDSAGTPGKGLENYEEFYYLVWTERDGPDGPPYTWYGDPNDYLPEYSITAAFPPTQTRHGNYTEYTDACTACHGLHSALHPKLLKGPTVTDLCATCHDGTGSKYDEVRGYVRLADSWSKKAYAAAGPFGDHLKAGSGMAVTSAHNVLRSNGPSAARVWFAPGSGFSQLEYDNTPPSRLPNRPEPVADYISNEWFSWLVCTSCHEPHNRGRNYRLLRPVINDWTRIRVRGVSEVDSRYADPDQFPNFCLGQTCDLYDDRGEWQKRAMYTKLFYGTERFCIACHRAFFSVAATGRYPHQAGDQPVDEGSGASATHVWGGHRHAIGLPAIYGKGFAIDGVWVAGTSLCGMSLPDERTGGDVPCGDQAGVTDPELPLQGRADFYDRNAVVCLTCHVPHGSGSERIEVAYRNQGTNQTLLADRDPVTGYLWNRADRTVDGAVYARWVDLDGDGVVDTEEIDDPGGLLQKETPVSPGRDLDGDGTVDCDLYGYTDGDGDENVNTECPFGPGVDQNGDGNPWNDLYLPGEVPYWTQYGFSSALARFNPFAQACYRCHGLRVK